MARVCAKVYGDDEGFMWPDDRMHVGEYPKKMVVTIE